MDSISHILYTSAAALPDDWDATAGDNVFLSRTYLSVLEQSGPANMECHFVGFFRESCLCGVMLAQFLDLNKLESFGERDNCLKTYVRNFVFRNFASHVLFIGNNMLTGQNAFVFSQDVSQDDAARAIKDGILSLKERYKNRKKPVHITSIKDFTLADIERLETRFPNHYRFTTQPNMVFRIPEEWNTIDDYVAALSKKYRDQFKRSHKRAEGVEKRKMKLEDIVFHEKEINELYFHVAKNAPFNTFFLAPGHFRDFKEKLCESFLFYGYFFDGKLVGFNTLVRNGDTMDTYFLGYDESVQRDKMLYLNMLYDMLTYSIKKGFSKIIFARTALEIKSSIGAVPLDMYGLIHHSNPVINRYIGKLFGYLEPKTEWQQRHPFK